MTFEALDDVSFARTPKTVVLVPFGAMAGRGAS
jgi:hypothetical protein